MLEHSHGLLEGLDRLAPVADPSEAELAALAMEDCDQPEKRVEDAKRIAAVLGLRADWLALSFGP